MDTRDNNSFPRPVLSDWGCHDLVIDAEFAQPADQRLYFAVVLADIGLNPGGERGQL
jgi:hypothetical protein